MSSTPSTSKSKGFLDYFRSGIRFSERLVKNLIVQTKWIFRSSRKLHQWFLSLHPTPHQALPFVYGLIVAVIMMIIIIPVFIWAFIKSI